MKWICTATLVVALSCQTKAQDVDSTVSVIKGDLIIGAEIEGELEAVNAIDISFPNIRWIWDSKISFLAAEGEEYKKGDKLAKFDDKELKKKLDDITARRDTVIARIKKQKLESQIQRRDNSLSVKNAEATLKKASLKANQPAEDTASNLLRQLKIDEEIAKTTLSNIKEKNRFQILKAKQALSIQERNLERYLKEITEITENIESMTVLAPDDGTLLYKKNWRGEKISVGGRVWRGMAVVELVSVDKLKAKAQVAEIEISKVAVDQKVSFRVESHPDIEIEGNIEKVSENVRRKDPEKPLKVIDLELSVVLPKKTKLRPGMSLRGRAESTRLKDVLLIPTSAVSEKDGQILVTLKTKNGPQNKTIQIGPQDNQWIQVISGLTKGDVIYKKGAI